MFIEHKAQGDVLRGIFSMKQSQVLYLFPDFLPGLAVTVQQAVECQCNDSSCELLFKPPILLRVDQNLR